MKYFASLIVACMLMPWAAFTEEEPAPYNTFEDQPPEQRDAVRKILALGGDWESASRTVLIGFEGDKFDNDTFKLLTPLVDLRHLYFHKVPADDQAFAHCRELTNVQWLQIDNCNFTGEGLKHLRKCEGLKNVHIDDTPLTDAGLAELAKFANLEVISITDLDGIGKFTAEGVRKFAGLKKLKHLTVDLRELPEGFKAELCEKVPKGCTVYLHGVGGETK